MSARAPAGGRAAAALLAAAALAAGCAKTSDDGGPRPTSITPDRGPVTVAVPVRIEGEFDADVKTDFSRPDESEVDARFRVRLGDVALEAVQLRPDGSISAVVPAGLATGHYDLTVVDPQGRAGTLPRAYRVLAPSDSTSLVAAFRVEAVGAQEAYRPFPVAITAVDAAGATVEQFNGSVRLADSTGTAVPASAGLFVAGRWTGLVEIRAAHGADVLTAVDGAGNTGSSGPFAVAPAPAAHVAFTTAPIAAGAGRCEGPVTLAIHDAFGTPTEAAGPTALSLAATPSAGFELFDGDSCTTAIGAAAVAAGQGTVTVSYRATRAGTLDLLASGPSLGNATQRHTVAPAAPAVLAFVTPAQTVNAGACSQQASVEVRDVYGNPSPPASATIALEGAPAGGLAFFGDASCSGAVSQVAVAPGATRASFHFRGTVAQTVRATATSAGLTPAAQDEIVTPEGTASNLVVLSPPRTTPAGECSGEVTLQAQDSFGNAVASAGAVQVTLSAPPGSGVAFFADAACTVPISALEIGAGQSTTGFHTRGTRAGPVVVTASCTTLTDAQQAQVVVAGAPARLAFASVPQTVTAGTCSGETTLVLHDAWDNVAVAATPVTVALAADPAAGFAFHSDPLCSGGGAGATIPAGGSTSRAFFRGTTAGTVAISATASGLGGATQAETIAPGPADRVAFVTSPQTTAAGACSGAVTVEVRDAHGNASPVAAGLAIGLSASPSAGFAFFRDAACGVPVASASVPAGSSSASFFFSGTAPGAVTATAAAAGLAQATQQETVNAANPAQLAFVTPSWTFDAGGCSSAIAVQTQDRFGNASAPAAPLTIDLAASPAAGLTFHEGGACAGPAVTSVALSAGASIASLSLRSTVAGPVTVTASAAALSPASQAHLVRPAAATRLVFTSAAQAREAGKCSGAVTFQVQDAWGNEATLDAEALVTLAATPPDGFVFYSDGACTSPLADVLTLAAGASGGTFHFAGTVPGDVSVTAWGTALAAAPDQVERITSGPPERLALSGGPQTRSAGDCSAPMTVRSEDGYGNPAPVTTTTAVALSAAPAAGFTLYAGAGCSGPAVSSIDILAGDPSATATFSFRGTVAGSVTITASAAGRSPSPSEIETISAGAPDHLVFVAGPQTRTAGTCSAAVTLEARDLYENPAPAPADGSIALAASPPGGFAFHAGAGCAGSAVASVPLAAGASTATFSFRGTLAGSVTITASAAGMSPDASQVETIQAGPPDHLAFAEDPQSVVAGNCSAAVTVRALDASGNPIVLATPAAVSLTASPAAGFAFHAGAGCTGAATSTVTISAGASATTFSFAGTAAGAVSIRAGTPGMTPDPVQVDTIVPAPPDRLVFVTSPQTTTAGVCSAVARVESRDPYGNPSPVGALTAAALAAAPSGGFAFHSDPSCATTVTGTSLAAGASAADLYWRGTAAGAVAVTATAGGWTPASQTATVTPGATDRFAWDAIPSPQAQGVPFAVTVRARDAWGNATPAFGGTASLAASAGTASCASSCSGPSTTGGFTAGVWTGSATVQPQGTGVTLTATSGAVSGTSNAFDVTGAATRSPPFARFTASPVVIVSGQSVTFDASTSSDYVTPVASLQVSWDFQADASSFTTSNSPRTTPPTAPWTAWTTTKTASHTYTSSGTYYPRLAVKDDDPAGPDIGYGTATVIVLSGTSSLCTVNTAADVDDGASSCSTAGYRGTDGKLSLREAIRLVNAGGFGATPTIAFGGPMTISGTETLTISRSVNLVAQAGVILDTLTLSISGSSVLLSGLELARQAGVVTVQSGADVTMRDVYQHDGAGIVVLGHLYLNRVRMSGCLTEGTQTPGTCLRLDGTSAQLAMWYSELRSTGGNVGVALDVCDTNRPASGVYQFSPWIAASLLSGFDTAVRSSCALAAVYSNTFVANGTAVYGSGLYLLSNVFAGQTATALGPPTCVSWLGWFPRQQLVWQNASNGCLAGDVSDPPTQPTDTFTADPLFIFPAARDYRIQYGSPAKDSGFDYAAVGYAQDLNDSGPGYYFGA
ncbi:MAG TPA: hypothetical protein VFL83_04045, partial [Anaeromyxobacter sp.]|nr:hypothetical protein [Anaeromyxobacter sp.]